MRATCLFSFISVVLVPATAHALVKVSADDPSELAVLGDISPFDAITFEGLANDAEQHGHAIRTVKFDSPGGDIGLALKIAAIIDSHSLDTRVAAGGLCASACVLPLAAGKRVHVGAGARVGVHQARNAEGGDAWFGTYSMAAFLASHHVAHSVAVKLLDTPHDGKAYLTAAEMRESGWAVEEPTAPANVMPGASFDLSDIDRLLEKRITPEPIAVTIVSQHEVSCAGNGSRFSTFQVARMPDGTERVFVAGSDAGNVIKGGKLGRACSSIPAGTVVAGQWESQTAQPATATPTPLSLGEVVAVPRRADIVPTVIPAPVEATRQRPRTLLDSVNGLVADLFGSAVSVERRFGLVGE